MDHLKGKEYQTYFFLLASAVIVAFITYLMVNSFSQRAVLPKKHERYDITRIYVAVTEEVCGENARAPLSTTKYENCIKDLSLEDGKRSSAWVPLEIPDLDWVLDNYRPSFNQTLKKVDERVWKRIYEDVQSSMIGFTVPSKYVEVNDFDNKFYRLVIGGAGSVLACFSGHCEGFRTYSDPTGTSVPLFAKSSPKSEKFNAFLFINHIDRIPFSIALETGLFITKNELFGVVNATFISSRILLRFSFAFVFLGILLLCVWQTLVWKRFIDYSSFLFFVSSIVLVSITYIAAVMDSIFSVDTTYRIRAFSWINLNCASIYFACATSRWSIDIYRVYIVPMFIGFILWLIFFSDIIFQSFPNQGEMIQVGVGFFPAVISAVSALNLILRLKETGKHEVSTKEVFRRRASQQTFLVFGFLSFGLVNIFNFVLVLKGTRSFDPFNTASVIAVIAIMATIFHPNISKLKRTLDVGYPETEVERLKLLMSRKDLHIWASQKRQGIFIEFDIAGSSMLTSMVKGKMHLLMDHLFKLSKTDLMKGGFSLIDVKYLGDAIVFVLNKKHNQIEDDLKDLLSNLRSRISFYETEIQNWLRQHLSAYDDEVYSMIGLHSCIYLTRSYSFQELNLEAAKGQTQRLDFVSEEMNYMMKYVGKAEGSQLAVVGPKEWLNDIKADKKSLREHIQESGRSINQNLLEVVDRANLVVMLFDKKSEHKKTA